MSKKEEKQKKIDSIKRQVSALEKKAQAEDNRAKDAVQKEIKDHQGAIDKVKASKKFKEATRKAEAEISALEQEIVALEQEQEPLIEARKERAHREKMRNIEKERAELALEGEKKAARALEARKHRTHGTYDVSQFNK